MAVIVICAEQQNTPHHPAMRRDSRAGQRESALSDVTWDDYATPLQSSAPVDLEERRRLRF